MDEPTSGMDPRSRRIIWSQIKENLKAGDQDVNICGILSEVIKGKVS